MATQMITEPGPESCIKNRVDNKKVNCMLVDKNVSVEKKNNNKNEQKTKQTSKKNFWRLKLLLQLPNEFGDLCLA